MWKVSESSDDLIFTYRLGQYIITLMCKICLNCIIFSEQTPCTDDQPLFQLTPAMVKAAFEAMNVESLPENLPERCASVDFIL